MELLIAVRDGDRSEPGYAAARQHADGCAACRAELDRLHQRTAQLRALATLEPAHSAFPAVRQRLEADRRHRWQRRLSWAGLAAAAWAILPVPNYVHLAAGAVALVASINSLTGLIPVAGYDGSEALGEWLGVPGLHRQALAYGLARLRRRPVAAPGGHARLFIWYSLGFVVYNLAMIGIVAALILR